MLMMSSIDGHVDFLYKNSCTGQKKPIMKVDLNFEMSGYSLFMQNKIKLSSNSYSVHNFFIYSL